MLLMSHKMMPTYHGGFARYAAESEAPGQWPGLGGAWYPTLGPTGVTLRDVSGHKKDGVLTNMAPNARWVSGPYGWQLNWANQVNEVVALPIIPYASAGTFTTIARWTDFGSNAGIFDQRNDGSNIIQFGTFFNGNIYWGWVTGGTGYRLVDSPANYGIAAGTYYHLVLTWNDATNETYLYKDGIRIDSKVDTLATYTPTTGAFLGNEGVGEAQPFQGDLVCYRYYDRALTAAEVAEHAADPFALIRRRRTMVSFAPTVEPEAVTVGPYDTAFPLVGAYEQAWR